ncbi:unnamed protein product [Cyprideis torosa]|uniref:Uncharacterized protein n=1 Tax=Cyprideis torosa TaxID=163714 RepID=A0A7R8WI35_9CRUS|nr:unnamed protein product [Cyprideis torosa]CAG0898262.1 unnamed protein product [Cyprideis torosa]
MGRLFCDTCPEAFDNFADLDEHRRGHTSRGDFSCEICGRRCSRRDKLRLHLWRHEATGCSILSQKAADQQMRATSKCPTCEVCGKAFADYKHLGNHMATHSFRYQHQCDICSRKFKNARLLRAHYNRHGNQNKLVCPDCGKTFVDKLQEHHVPLCSARSCLLAQEGKTLTRRGAATISEIAASLPRDSTLRLDGERLLAAAKLAQSTERLPVPQNKRPLQQSQGMSPTTIQTQSQGVSPTIISQSQGISPTILPQSQGIGPTVIQSQSEGISPTILPQSQGIGPTAIQTQSQGISPTIISQSHGISQTILPQSQGIGPTVIQTPSQGISPTILHLSQGISHISQAQGISLVPQGELVSLPVTTTTHRLIAIRPSSLTPITSTPVSFIVSPQPQPTQISSPAPGQFQDNAMMPQYAYNAPRTVPIATAQQQLAINEPMDDAHYGPM